VSKATRSIARAWFRPSFAVLGAAILLCLGIAMSLYEDRLLVSQEIDDITVQANILSASVEAALVFDDKATTQEYVTGLSRNPQIETVGAYDGSGTLVAHYERLTAAAVPRHVQIRQAGLKNNRITIITPVMQGGSRVGFVYLRAYTESLARRLLRYGGIMLLAVMAALLLSVLGLAQKTLTEINLELQERASALSDANRMLQVEMHEREKAEAALRQSQKMEAIGQLSGGIAHDFNNLLMIVGGNLQLLRKRLAQGHIDVQRYLDAANEALTRASTVTQRILAFSRRQPLSPKPVNLSRLVEEMSDLIGHSVGEHIHIAAQLNSEWQVQCDKNQMENVVLNLAINARDAMANGGVLSIATNDIRLDGEYDELDAVMSGDYVQLRVNDTGAGMSEDVLKKAVDPFFTTKPAGQGTGLGLSMAFGFVRQSNGQMKIESEVGRGTTITILMPRHDSEQTQTGA